MSLPVLRRYTNLAVALDVLHSKCLTLLSPEKWDDRNDAFFMGEYKAKTGARSVLALCFAEAPETYHHWRVFSHGIDGVCFEFDKDRLQSVLTTSAGVIFRPVSYKTINQARSEGIETGELPFVKRWAYRDEVEFRALYTDFDQDEESVQISIPINCIRRVTLSPWMTGTLSKTVKKILRSLLGCSRLPVYRSTLIGNEDWMRLANPKLKP
jgi:hypothetical protein